MTDPRPIAIARTFAELVDGMAALIAERKVDHLSLDAAAGLAEGHTGKIMCGSKGYGPQSFDAHLAALGGCIVIAIDPEREPRITASIKRKAPDAKARLAMRERVRKSRELLSDVLLLHSRKAGKKGGKETARRMNPNQRIGRARKAALARWKRPRVTEIKGAAASAIRAADTSPAAGVKDAS